MGLLDSILGGALGGGIGGGGSNALVKQIAKQFGIPESLAQLAISALLPALSKGLQRNSLQSGGMDSLMSALSGGAHEKYVDEPETLSSPESIEDGKAILGHIFGSKDVSRNVAANAAQKTGIDVETLKAMLPALAGVAMGALEKQSAGGQLSGLQSGGAAAQANPMDLLSGFLGADDQDGDSLDEVLDLTKKLFGNR